MIELSEPVNVWAVFAGSSVKPLMFSWRSRRIKIDRINLVHTTRDGGKLFYFFSISSGGNFYRLKFDLSKLKWFLEAVEED